MSTGFRRRQPAAYDARFRTGALELVTSGDTRMRALVVAPDLIGARSPLE